MDEEEEDADVEEEDPSQDREADFVRACAIEMHMGSAQELFCIEIHRKSTGRQSRDTRFVRACAVEMLTDISQEPFRKNGCGHLRGHRFVRACAVEMHMDMSQEAFRVENYRENARRFRYHLD